MSFRRDTAISTQHTQSQPQAKPVLGIGLVGACAGISRSSLAPAVRRNPHAEILAVMDVQPGALSEVAREYGAEAHTRIEDIVARSDIDVIMVTSPDALHAEHTVRAADAGKHVFCTKPLALSMEEAHQMRDAVKANGITFMCGMNTRYTMWARTMKLSVSGNNIGKPVFVEWRTKGDFFPYPEGHPYRKAAGGGQLVHNGAHYLDTMSYWIDSLPVSVYAVSTRHYAKGDTMESDNYCNVSLAYESGAIGHLEYNQLLVTPRGYPAVNMVTIVGTKGMVQISADDRRAIELYSDGRLLHPAPAYAPAENSGFNAMVDDFVECLRGGAPPPIPIEHSMRILEACLKGLSSARLGRPCPLTAPKGPVHVRTPKGLG